MYLWALGMSRNFGDVAELSTYFPNFVLDFCFIPEKQCRLAYLVHVRDELDTPGILWDDVLSLGEQQRLQFCRPLLYDERIFSFFCYGLMYFSSWVTSVISLSLVTSNTAVIKLLTQPYKEVVRKICLNSVTIGEIKNSCAAGQYGFGSNIRTGEYSVWVWPIFCYTWPNPYLFESSFSTAGSWKALLAFRMATEALRGCGRWIFWRLAKGAEDEPRLKRVNR